VIQGLKPAPWIVMESGDEVFYLMNAVYVAALVFRRGSVTVVVM